MKRGQGCLIAVAAVLIGLSVPGTGHRLVFPPGAKQEEQSLKTPSVREPGIDWYFLPELHM